MLCNCHSSIRINDHSTPHFPLKRGVRQGDIISPILFTLAIELFQRLAIINFPRLASPIMHNTVIPPLMYADNITIATRSQSGLNEWLKIIEIIYQSAKNNNHSQLHPLVYCDKQHRYAFFTDCQFPCSIDDI